MKKVIFVPSHKNVSDILDFPKSSKNYLPQWYKNLGSKFTSSDGFLHPGPTKCLPFLESFTSGYTHVLPCDVEVKFQETKNGRDILSYRWFEKIRPIITRQEENGAPYAFPSFDGYYNTELQWYTSWDPKTPKGYSTMYHHPSNRFDLPFHTFTGITDTDKWSGWGPIPFLLKKGFEGIIPAGTPIIQFTFIKREKWKSTSEEYDEKKHQKTQFNLKRYWAGGYKKHYWEKKEFE